MSTRVSKITVQAMHSLLCPKLLGIMTLAAVLTSQNSYLMVVLAC